LPGSNERGRGYNHDWSKLVVTMPVGVFTKVAASGDIGIHPVPGTQFQTVGTEIVICVPSDNLSPLTTNLNSTFVRSACRGMTKHEYTGTTAGVTSLKARTRKKSLVGFTEWSGSSSAKSSNLKCGFDFDSSGGWDETTKTTAIIDTNAPKAPQTIIGRGQILTAANGAAAK